MHIAFPSWSWVWKRKNVLSRKRDGIMKEGLVAQLVKNSSLLQCRRPWNNEIRSTSRAYWLCDLSKLLKLTLVFSFGNQRTVYHFIYRVWRIKCAKKLLNVCYTVATQNTFCFPSFPSPFLKNIFMTILLFSCTFTIDK